MRHNAFSYQLRELATLGENIGGKSAAASICIYPSKYCRSFRLANHFCTPSCFSTECDCNDCMILIGSKSNVCCEFGVFWECCEKYYTNTWKSFLRSILFNLTLTYDDVFASCRSWLDIYRNVIDMLNFLLLPYFHFTIISHSIIIHIVNDCWVSFHVGTHCAIRLKIIQISSFTSLCVCHYVFAQS